MSEIIVKNRMIVFGHKLERDTFLISKDDSSFVVISLCEDVEGNKVMQPINLASSDKPIMAYKFFREIEKLNGLCDCSCHTIGTRVMHFMACCNLTYQKYLNSDRYIEGDLVNELLNKREPQ